MAIKIPFGNKVIECDTVEEAERMLEVLRQQDADERRIREQREAEVRQKFAELTGDRMDLIDDLLHPVKTWTPPLFLKFIDRLGADQQTILSILVTQGRVSDEELRNALNVSNNQALAGVISGISKQAAALEIVARAVFGIENHRRAGELTKIYFIADEFQKIAQSMNWPSSAAV
jgi:DNA-directed RNA polymerase subunit F